MHQTGLSWKEEAYVDLTNCQGTGHSVEARDSVRTEYRRLFVLWFGIIIEGEEVGG